MRRQAERDTLLIRKVTSWLGKAPSRPAHFKTACPRCAFPDQKHRTSKIEHRRPSGKRANLPAEGIEPTRSCDHWILSPARLPVPPRRRAEAKLRKGGRSSSVSRYLGSLAKRGFGSTRHSDYTK